MNVRKVLTVSIAVVLLVLLTACAEEPVVQEQFPEPHPWFSVDSVVIEDSGMVTVEGTVLSDASAPASASETEAEDATWAADPGEFPEHIAYGFWPDPDEVGAGEAVEVADDGTFVFTYDFSRPEGIRKGWHVLQFDKADWGSQMIWVNVATGEWSETAPG